MEWLTPELTLVLVLLAPLAGVAGVTSGVGALTGYAVWRGRGDPRDAAQARAFARARARLDRWALWVAIEGLWTTAGFLLQAAYLLAWRRRAEPGARPGVAPPPGTDGATPVLLVAGYLENPGLFWLLARRLRARGFFVVPVTLPSTLAPIAANARFLGERIEALRALTGAARVAVVGHSMGGVVARALVRAGPGAPVASVVTIASPHRGTHLARLGVGDSARDLLPGSAQLSALPPAGRGPVPVHCLVGFGEDIVSPAWSSLLGEGEDWVLDVPAGHVTPLFLPSVAARVAAWLEADGVAPLHGSRLEEATA